MQKKRQKKTGHLFFHARHGQKSFFSLFLFLFLPIFFFFFHLHFCSLLSYAFTSPPSLPSPFHLRFHLALFHKSLCFSSMCDYAFLPCVLVIYLCFCFSKTRPVRVCVRSIHRASKRRPVEFYGGLLHKNAKGLPSLRKGLAVRG